MVELSRPDLTDYRHYDILYVELSRGPRAIVALSTRHRFKDRTIKSLLEKSSARSFYKALTTNSTVSVYSGAVFIRHLSRTGLRVGKKHSKFDYSPVHVPVL